MKVLLVFFVGIIPGNGDWVDVVLSRCLRQLHLHFNVQSFFWVIVALVYVSSLAHIWLMTAIDDRNSLGNHEGSVFLRTQFVSPSLIQGEHGFDILQARCCTRLWCFSAACYSNVSGDTRCWLGLYKSGSSTYWLDGNPSTYRNWYPGEPNSQDHCVYINDGKFIGGYCSVELRYICKGSYFCWKVIFR